MNKVLIIVFIIFLQRSLFAGLSVDPVVLEVVVKRDVETEGSFKVLNTGKNMIRIRVSPEGWSDWVGFEPQETYLGQDEKKEIVYKINPPEGFNGELRCMVFFIADETGEKKSNIGIRFGVPIYAVVSGTEILDVDVSSAEFEYSDNALSGTIFIDNKGNIHIRPNVNIEIKDAGNNLIYNFDIPYGQPVQAGQNRPFMFQEEKALPEGRYTALIKVDFGRLYGVDRVATKDFSFVVRHGPKVNFLPRRRDEM